MVSGGKSNIGGGQPNPIAIHDFLQKYLDASSYLPGVPNLSSVLISGNTTGTADVVMTAGQKIGSSSGDCYLDLQADGTDDTFVLMAAPAYATSYVYGGISAAQIGFGNYYVESEVDNVTLLGLSTSVGFMGFQRSGLSSGILPSAAIFVMNNQAAPSVATATTNHATFINSGLGGSASTINTGIDNSVALGGVGLTVTKNNTPYTNQLALQPSGSSFDCILKPGVLTADIEIDYPLVSGRALVQRVVAVTSTPHTAVDGEVILLDTNAADPTGPSTVNLPVATTNMRITIKNLTGVQTIIVDGNGAELVEGGATLVIAAVANNFVTLVASGNAWYVVSQQK